MEACKTDTMITHAFGIFKGTVRACCIVSAFKMMCAERILKWARIPEVCGGHDEADILGKNARRDVYRE